MNLPPIETTPSADVVQLDVKFKKPVDQERFLVAENPGCCHFNGPFLIDEKAAEVTCGNCKTKLNPMWVLQQLLNQENKWHQSRAIYLDEMKRLAERSATKCQHCKKMTRISRN